MTLTTGQQLFFQCECELITNLLFLQSNSGTDDEDWFLDEDNQLQKRQYDDYGHMRFGKRQNDFDDYGHLRFGK